MRISFDNRDLAEIKKATESYSKTPDAGIKGVSGAFDISGAIPEDNLNYENKKMSVNDLKNSLKAVDVQNNVDYMTVMAHQMSSEDYAKMLEGGVNPMSAEVSDTVTILDRIKLEVAKGGTEIEGFTDTLDEETIEAMTGSRKINVNGGLDIPGFDVTVDNETIKESVEAFKEISEVTEMTEGMKKFFMTTGKELTVDNLYLARHSSETFNTPEGRRSSYFSIETPGYLAKRADADVIEDIGAEVEKLLKGLSVTVDEETVENGTWLVNNSVCVTKESLGRLKEINEVTLPVSGENFVKMAASAIAEGRSPKEALITRTDDIYKEAVKLTRVMEETRLKMTTEANLVLLKSDYKIDTKDLESYVEALKAAEASPEYKELKAISEVTETVAAVKELPAAIIAPMAMRLDSLSLTEIKTEGSAVKARFDAIEAAYEQVGTKVRKDLGDSIKKAFRNVDEILSETGEEITPENRRAVRILGYNGMSINKDSIEKIKAADMKLNGVLDRITPEDTLKLIRSGKSPIKMSVNELNEYLDNKEINEKEEIEKYSKFLYKLERNHEITPEERKEFIEVYRFFYKLEKTDYAAVGSVLNAGGELTLKNLKTAMQSAKHTGSDIKIDDSFGFLVSDIRSELSPEKVAKAEFSDETSLDALYKSLADAEVTQTYEEDWNREQLRELKQAMRVPEETVSELVMNKVPVTAENLRAAYGLMKRRGNAFAEAIDTAGDDIKNAAADLPEAFEEKETAEKAYDSLLSDVTNAVYENAMESDTYLDVRAMKLTYAELSLARKYARSETYEVPMEISGRMTSVNLKIVHNPDEEANVTVSLETEELGRIDAKLFVENEEIGGYIACNLQETVTEMEKVADKISKGIKVIRSRNVNSDAALSRIPMRDNSEEISTADLYSAAKKFLGAMKEIR